MNLDFLARLDSAMQAKGLNQSELSRKIGASRQLISQIRCGERPGTARMPKIAEALGVTIEWLTTGSPAHAPEWAKREPIATPDPLAVTLREELAKARAANALLSEDLAAERAARVRLEKALAQFTKSPPILEDYDHTVPAEFDDPRDGSPPEMAISPTPQIPRQALEEMPQPRANPHR